MQTGPLPAAECSLKRHENVKSDGYRDRSVDSKRTANFHLRELFGDQETNKSLRVSILSVKTGFHFETEIRMRI